MGRFGAPAGKAQSGQLCAVPRRMSAGSDGSEEEEVSDRSTVARFVRPRTRGASGVVAACSAADVSEVLTEMPAAEQAPEGARRRGCCVGC